MSKEVSEPRCPKCGGSRLYVKAYRDTKHSGRKSRYSCKDCGHLTVNPVGTDSVVEFASELPKSKRYVITTAQNATPVFRNFWGALLQYCKHRNAKLVVIPIRYKNPTSVWLPSQDSSEWWCEEVLPYLYDGRGKLNKNVMVVADVKVQPTAVSPLAGFDTITGPLSGVIGHPKLELKCIPTPHHKLPKIMTTTGSCTQPNYTDSRAGKTAEFHHTFGAAVVEVESDKIFHLRQINAVRDGSFCDLKWKYTAAGVVDHGGVDALIMGDTHVDFVDPDVVDATFEDRDSIVSLLRPKQLVWHDVLDFHSRSHWHENTPFVQYAKRKAHRDNVMDEIKRAVEFIDKYSKKGVVNVLVPSNHHDALTRWVERADWKKDMENVEMYLETALEMAKSATLTENGTRVIDPWLFWAKRLLKCASRTKFLERDLDFYTIRGIEVSMHGDVGPHGSKGSRKSLSRVGVKSVIGHSHSPGITEGCYQTGTSTRLKLEYNRGPSGWMQTHCVIYPNGKRTLLNIIHGAWQIGAGKL